MRSDLRKNFEEKIERRGDKWIWTGSLNTDGYPKMKDHGKLRLASHVSLELAGRSAPPPGKVVMHKDNNPRNIAPWNLEVGTQKENLKQMRDEGRDRPRGVDQEPDVKKHGAAAGSRAAELGTPERWMLQIAENAFKKKAMMAAFFDEMGKILAYKSMF